MLRLLQPIHEQVYAKATWLIELTVVERVSNLKFYEGSEQLCEKIFIPMNDNNKHWFLLVINVSGKKAEVWDSFPMDKENKKRMESAKEVVSNP